MDLVIASEGMEGIAISEEKSYRLTISGELLLLIMSAIKRSYMRGEPEGERDWDRFWEVLLEAEEVEC